MRLVHLLDAALAATVAPEFLSLNIHGVAHDSRQVTPGTLFAAWTGSNSDGHDFIGEAVAKGACFVLCQRPPAQDVPYVLCADPRRSLAAAAARLYQEQTAAVSLVGITGTNGKTTTAHVVAAMQAAAGGRAAVFGTLGVTHIERGGHMRIEASPANLTTPEAPELLAALAVLPQQGCTGAALEVSSIALAQGRIEGLQFDVCAMTNLSHDHLDFHGDMQAYMDAKTLLFSRHRKADGRIVINADDPRQRPLYHEGAFAFSSRGAIGRAGTPARIYALSQHHSREGLHLKVHTPAGVLEVHSALVGSFNVENILTSIAIGTALRLPSDAIVAGIAQLAHVPGRLQRIAGGRGAPLVLVDYAHTPDALARTLAVARQLSGAGRLFCVFGCGGDRDRNKRAPMGAVAAQAADWCVVTNDNPRTEDPSDIAAQIVAGLRDAGASSSEVPMPTRTAAGQAAFYCLQLDRAAAIAWAIGQADANDTVLLAGKGHEPYQLIGTQSFAFDDRLQAQAALTARFGPLEDI